MTNIDKLQSDMKAKTSELRAMEKRLIELEIKRLIDVIVNDESCRGQKVRCVYEHFVNGNTKMLQGISDGVLSQVKKDKIDIVVFMMLTMGISTKRGQYLIATNDEMILSPKNKDCKKKILAIIEGSGGGRPQRLQGKATCFRAYPKLFEFVKSLFPSAAEQECKVVDEKPDISVKDALSGLNQIIESLDS